MPHIFIHGLRQQPSSWEQMLSQMEAPIQALCPSLSETVGSKEVTYTNLYNSFVEYLNEFPEPVDICGLSLGGTLALNYAIDNPGRVNSLVLVGARAKVPKSLKQKIHLKLLPKGIFKGMAFQKKDMVNLSISLMGMDLSQGLKTIECPTLVLCGENDFPFKDASIFIAERIPGAELVFIENAEHQVNKDNPEQMAIEVDKFYKSL